MKGAVRVTDRVFLTYPRTLPCHVIVFLFSSSLLYDCLRRFSLSLMDSHSLSSLITRGNRRPPSRTSPMKLVGVGQPVDGYQLEI